MRLTIYQPQYFPRLHYFNRILDSDAFVILDSAQFTKSLVHAGDKEYHKSYQADTPIKTAQGVKFLTVPLKHEGYVKINQKQIVYSNNWQQEQILALKVSYLKSSRFEEIHEQIKKIVMQQHSNLAALNITTMVWGISNILGLDLDLDKLSIENLNSELKKNDVRLKRILTNKDINAKRPEGLQKGTEWTAQICKEIGATEYYHGETAKEGYMDLEYYKNLGILPITQNWRCGEYPQQFEDSGFIPNLSIIDLLFNADQERAREIILPK